MLRTEHQTHVDTFTGMGTFRTDTWLSPLKNVRPVIERSSVQCPQKVTTGREDILNVSTPKYFHGWWPMTPEDALAVQAVKLFQICHSRTESPIGTDIHFDAKGLPGSVVIQVKHIPVDPGPWCVGSESHLRLWFTLRVAAILAAKTGEVTLPFKLRRNAWHQFTERRGTRFPQNGGAQEVVDFLDSVYALARKNENQSATDVIFDYIDRLFCEGLFERCDEVLRELEINRLPTSLLRSFLTITFPARGRLRSRADLYTRIRAEFLGQMGEAKMKRLLDGLA